MAEHQDGGVLEKWHFLWLLSITATAASMLGATGLRLEEQIETEQLTTSSDVVCGDAARQCLSYRREWASFGENVEGHQ